MICTPAVYQISRNQGFTLLEILIVAVIVGIMSVAAVNLINIQSVERQMMNDATALQGHIHYLCEKSVLENRPLGIEFVADGYETVAYQNGTWQTLSDQQHPKFSTELSIAVLLGGREQDLAEESEQLPHLVCQSDGSINAFEIKLNALGAESDNHLILRNESPWKIVAAWHEQ